MNFCDVLIPVFYDREVTFKDMGKLVGKKP